MAESNVQSDLLQVPLTAPVFEAAGLPEEPSVSDELLSSRAAQLARQWQVSEANAKNSAYLKVRLQKLDARLKSRLAACAKIADPRELTPQLELLESSRMLQAVLSDGRDIAKHVGHLARVHVPEQGDVPRGLRVAEEYLDAADGIWSAESLGIFMGALQQYDPLNLREILSLPAFLKLAQLEFLVDRAEETFAAGPPPPIEQSPFSAPLHSLRRLNQFEWPDLLERLTAFYPVLARDPHGVFVRMDEETRAGYMGRVAELARRSDSNEMQVAEAAVERAMHAEQNPGQDVRLARRRAHVGYYLFEEGLPELARLIGYHPPAKERFRAWLLRNGEDAYILSIFVVSVIFITSLIAPIVPHHAFWPTIAAMLVALLPATQGASDLVNNAVMSFMQPRALPKLDYTEGIPEEAATFVVVPTLLLNETQVLELFEELEARWLSNTDRHLHFGLLTDLPDSTTRPQEDDYNELVDLAVRLTDGLNAKYDQERGGAFLLLHRKRIFNQRQGVWMGWERKRGKLLELNQLLVGEFDNFAIKAGPTEVLRGVRYVITLDSDTQLPRNTAARMIGTLAHPLNQAIIDSHRRVVTKGYGILQPRVGVSVASASRSRLAFLYSGETGYDIYTRAISDVYQDLFGEGIFTGKGIYEASVLHTVLHRRFPSNTLLSHDLIEGAYVRAGLVTDIEVIDDYPSHYSAHMRRKHRWVRGDWQIAHWLLNKVPDESGKLVSNPISLLSQWKILDNLRRSLVEPITFLLLVSGWLFLPGGARYWTFIVLAFLLVPVLVQLVFSVARGLFTASWLAVVEAFRTFWSSLGFQLLNFVFLPHQTLLSLDAIIRSLIRRFVTGRRLLEWETAAQAEATRTRSSLDLYLQLSPLVSLAIAALMWISHRRDLWVASPILVLWAIAPLITGWLNSPHRKLQSPLKASDREFLERQALLTWRYYAEFGGEENHWLIPDNVEEDTRYQAPTLSPTNLGMLLNARQAALSLGFTTVPEFTLATLGTLKTYARLEKVQGHIYNWINIPSLHAVAPFTISAVDSGNLAASLYALRGGALDLLKRPVLTQEPFAALQQMMGKANSPRDNSVASLRSSLNWLDELGPIEAKGQWVLEEAERRRIALLDYAGTHLPWVLPRFAPLFEREPFSAQKEVIPTMQAAVAYAYALNQQLVEFNETASGRDRELAAQLRASLPGAMESLGALVSQLQHIADLSQRYADDMRFDFLLVEARQLLSIGFDGETKELHSACYDLLASEARIATFLAIAKGDIPQRAWFRLGRTHVLVKGRASLLSWTGTMFEYLMPTLWMRHYQDTLMSRSIETAVFVQQKHVKTKPWGISESGTAKRNAMGHYGYQAWGIPALASKYGAEDGPVISPYSTFLALQFARKDALRNLRHMAKLGWVGEYGFYEAADYTSGEKKPELVRSWMAHHQGMSLLAVTNLLQNNVFQTWFHANPEVRATELLLHERPLGKPALRELASVAPQSPALSKTA